ncbi:MAG: flagellar biosynthesis anti-sigma factor FlgM [Fimbriimonas sp.]
MRISDNEIKKVLSKAPADIVDQIVEIGEHRGRSEDQAMVEKLTAEVMAMPDREEMIANLRARIEAGTYNPTSEEIVDGMVRRAIADSIR